MEATSSLSLTPRQHQVLSFIERSIDERGLSPTIREIARAFGWRSTHGVVGHLRALKKKGAIILTKRSARSIQLPDGPTARLRKAISKHRQAHAGHWSEADLELYSHMEQNDPLNLAG